MKVLGVIGCVLSMWGIIWGIFLPSFMWLCAIGMVLMVFACVFMEE